MKIAISGYGRMGRLIRLKALEAGHEVVAVIDPVSTDRDVTASEISAASLKDAQVVIDFTIPSVVIGNISRYAEIGISCVVGTTGWYDRMDEVSGIVGERIGCIWSGNFSVGVHLFFEMVRKAAAVMDGFGAYDCMVHEFHHNKKADSPSGTAAMIGKILIDGLDRKSAVVTEMLDRPIEAHELHVSSTRGGAIPGTHTVIFDSPVDSIELTHRARNREGFAAGSITAAEWIDGRKGFFSIDDLLQSLIGEQV